MKILIPLVGSFGKSGGFRVMSQLANYWIKDGHQVIFLSYKKSSGPYFPTVAKIIYYDNSGKLFELPDENYKNVFFGAFSLRKILQKVLNKQEADVVLATHSLTADPVMRSIINAKKFYYVQAYEPDYFYSKDLKSRIYKLISKKSYQLGLNIIVNAPMYLNYHEIHTDKFVFPGLDFNIFKPNINPKNPDKIILGTIGRLEEYKGTKYVVEAFKQLRRKIGTKIELHIAFGDKTLTNEDGIKLITPNGDEELASYYNSLDIYICAGLIQLNAVHYPVIESMACKVPVITTGYLPSNENNSWLIQVDNSNEIISTVLELLNNSKLRIEKTNKAFEDIKIFEWSFISKKMMNYMNL